MTESRAPASGAARAAAVESLTYAPVQTVEGDHEVERLQQEVWGIDPLDTVPLHLLLTAHKNEGILIGAHEPGGRMIGFVFGFLGRQRGKLRHCSHMTGVLAEWRHLGVGERLKWLQADAVRAQGLDLITWTFDPLQAPNANLNLRKLGGVARSYSVNLYGVMTDAINQGTDSDRLNVEWWIDSERVRRHRLGVVVHPTIEQLRAQGAEPVLRSEPVAGSHWLGPRLDPAARPEIALIEIPGDFQALKAGDAALAADWREAVRAAHLALYDAGYATVDFVRERGPAGRRGHYVLQPGDAIDLPGSG